MNGAYAFRLVCLCLACFFLLHFAAGLVVQLFSPRAIRISNRIRPRLAANFLLSLRLLPSGFALLGVAVFCIPSYLLLEPAGDAEEIGWICIAAAGLTVTIWGISLARGARAMIRSIRYIRHCQRIGRATQIPTEPNPVWLMEASAPFLILTGLVRSRLVVSQTLLQHLTAEQLSAALRHERAHGKARDNLKRLLILITPNMLPFVRSFRPLEHAWGLCAEWSADSSAVNGDSSLSLSLAEALVSLARLSVVQKPPALTASLLASPDDLTARVERLLSPKEFDNRSPFLMATALLSLLAMATFWILQPTTLPEIHTLLEHLIN